MAKRFTDTNKYKKPFIRGLKGAYKLLWDYLYHDCDHAGIWIVDFEIAQLYIGNDMPINKQDALKYFNEGEVRIVEIDGGKKWFIVPFIEFQYGQLCENNRVHKSVLFTLEKYGIKGHISPLYGAKDKDKDKDKEMDKDKDKEKESLTERKIRLRLAREEVFILKVKEYGHTYGEEMLQKFIEYWTEPNKSGSQMKWEMENTWDFQRRLKKWFDNSLLFKKNKDDLHVTDFPTIK